MRGLAPADGEVLELVARHGLTTSSSRAVLGVALHEVVELYDEARDRLRDGITAEILARKGPYDCPQRARILTGFAGELTDDLRGRLVGHLPICETCAPHRAARCRRPRCSSCCPRSRCRRRPGSGC